MKLSCSFLCCVAPLQAHWAETALKVPGFGRFTIHGSDSLEFHFINSESGAPQMLQQFRAADHSHMNTAREPLLCWSSEMLIASGSPAGEDMDHFKISSRTSLCNSRQSAPLDFPGIGVNTEEDVQMDA